MDIEQELRHQLDLEREGENAELEIVRQQCEAFGIPPEYAPNVLQALLCARGTGLTCGS